MITISKKPVCLPSSPAWLQRAGEGHLEDANSISLADSRSYARREALGHECMAPIRPARQDRKGLPKRAG